MPATKQERNIVIRDLLIFQLKLVLDSAKDIVLSPLAIVAAGADILFPTDRVGKRFYYVMRVGERFDSWLSLFGMAERAEAGEGGLFGASRAGSATMLGRLESMVLGHDEPEEDSFSGRRAA
ncbi:MAG: hypothetical protein ABIV28_04475 [Longimicrobiales bacterium]